MDGDYVHDQLRPLLRRGLLRTGSCYRLVSQEGRVETGGIVGHYDGYLKHFKRRCQTQDHLTVGDMALEVKSMSPWSFDDTVANGLSWEYRCQVSGYLRGMGMTRAVILIKNKATAEVRWFTYDIDDVLLDGRLDITSRIYGSKTPEEIPREYAPVGRLQKLPWQCGYCPFTELCWRHEGLVRDAAHKYHLNGVPSSVPKSVTLTQTVDGLGRAVSASTTYTGGVDGTGIATTTIPIPTDKDHRA